MLVITILFLVGFCTFLWGMEKQALAEIETAGIYLNGYFSRAKK